MSTESNDTSSDWRRQRRRSRGSATATPEAPPEETEELEPLEEEETTRTLFSYLEPFIDVIGSFGGPLVIAGVVGLITGIVLVAFVGSLRLYGFITLAFGLVLLVTVGLIFLSSVFAAFISRTGRYGVNSLVMLAAFLGILLVANFISFSNHSRIDVTATNQFSLATSTKDLLGDLDQPIHATAFYPQEFGQNQNMLARQIKVSETLQEFAARSNNFTYDFVDPELEPEVARDKGLTQYESIVVEGLDTGILDEVLRTDDGYTQLEQDLYTSLLVATGIDQKKIYFLSGHGERNIDTQLSEGYAVIRRDLEAFNYTVEELNWSAATEEVEVPSDAALLIVAGPRGELPLGHAEALNQFMLGMNTDGSERTEAGRLIFLVEPDTHETFLEFLTTWGIVAAQRYILDKSLKDNPHTLLLRNYFRAAPLEIIAPRGRPLEEVIMPGATALTAIDDGLREPRPLIGSSLDSYLVESIDVTEPITEGENAHPSGFFIPAYIIENGISPVGSEIPPRGVAEHQLSSLVVFGDSDFLANSLVNRGDGARLFLNSANYLLGDFSLASIRDRAFVFREFNLDKNEFNFVRFTSWLLLPGLMGLLAGLVWYIRR
ncbi:MAG: Gldg family protein [Dehalococcoidia bacterium]